MMIPKENAWRSKKYLVWVANNPSIISSQTGCDPHHIIGYGFSGMATKAPDWAVIPLTREEHTDLHNGIKKWEQRNGDQLFLLMRFWRANFAVIQGYFNAD